MIESQSNHAFGGRVTVISGPAEKCMISTAKDGLFSKQSTYLLNVTAGMALAQRFAHIIYPDETNSKGRLWLHDQIAERLDERINRKELKTLHKHVEEFFEELNEEGYAFGLLIA